MINVTLGEAKPQEKPFPKLMKSNANQYTLIALFTSKNEGTVLFDDNKIEEDRYEIGHYSIGWSMNKFTDYNEPITLQNA